MRKSILKGLELPTTQLEIALALAQISKQATGIHVSTYFMHFLLYVTTDAKKQKQLSLSLKCLHNYNFKYCAKSNMI